MKTLAIILTLTAASLAGSLSEYADSIGGTKAGWALMDRIVFLVAMDSVVSEWPDSVKAVKGPRGFTFDVAGTVLTEDQMRRIAPTQGFIGHSAYKDAVLNMLAYPLMKWRHNDDRVARKLHMAREWVSYRGMLPKKSETPDALAAELVNTLLDR